MIPFTTTDAQKVELYAIATQMIKEGLPDTFVAAAVKFAEDYEGAYDLMALWRDLEDPAERDACVSDLYSFVDAICWAK